MFYISLKISRAANYPSAPMMQPLYTGIAEEPSGFGTVSCVAYWSG